MVDDYLGSKPRPKRLSTSQRTMLTDEQGERLRNLTLGKYLGRVIFVGLIIAIGVHGVDDGRFRLSASVASGLFAFFWALDEFRQRNRLRRIDRLLQIFEEKTSTKASQDEIIRFD